MRARIKPYYFLLSRSYFSKLGQERIREFNAKLEGASLKKQSAILTEEMVKYRRRMLERQYNRHVLKFYVNIDYMQYDGFPRITVWHSSAVDLTSPDILKFIRVRDGKEHELSPVVTISDVRTRRGWW